MIYLQLRYFWEKSEMASNFSQGLVSLPEVLAGHCSNQRLCALPETLPDGRAGSGGR